MTRHLTHILLAVATTTLAQSASAQDLLAGKSVSLPGPAKTWTQSGTDATFSVDLDQLQKITAVPTNTANVYLFPEEGGGWATAENEAIGIQGFYIDLGSSQQVGIVSTTWEGAAADSYDIYLTDTEPTAGVPDTAPVYSASGLGQYQANTAVLPDGSAGRYLLFQPTKATNWGWGVKIRSISALAPSQAELTGFSVSPAIVASGVETAMTFSFTDQNGLAIDAADVTLTVSDNATLADGTLTVLSGTSATITATMGDNTQTAVVYVATAPSVPEAALIKTPVFTNTVTDANDTAGWLTAYNGGATDNGTVTFANGETARAFSDARCIFFYNTATTGAWNGSINPVEKGYRSLCISIFGSKDCTGSVEFEGTSGVIDHTQTFTLEAGKWNDVTINLVGETQLNNMSVRFSEADMCDILLANIYFTPAYVEGDEEAPVLAQPTGTATRSNATLTLSATDDLSSEIYYTVSDGTRTISLSGASGESVLCVFDGLEPGTEYTFTVTASDGLNVSEPATLTLTTETLPAAPAPEQNAALVNAVFSAAYGADTLPAFDNWGSAASAAAVKTANGSTVLMLSGYNGQWGGLTGLDADVEGMKYLHIDIYSDEDGSITLAPVWAAANGATTPNKPLTLAAGKWNSFDLPLADFDVATYGNTVTQLSLSESTVSSFALDNFYFWTDKETSVCTLTAAAPATVDVFTLTGARVRTGADPATATDGLAPGLYIVGGRKVLVK